MAQDSHYTVRWGIKLLTVLFKNLSQHPRPLFDFLPKIQVLADKKKGQAAFPSFLKYKDVTIDRTTGGLASFTAGGCNDG